MREIVFDTESDGLLHQMTKFTLGTLQIIDDGVESDVFAYRPHEMDDFVEVLKTADVLIGHNIVGHDLPAIEMVYPDWQLPEHVVIRDTMVLSRMVFADEKQRDFRRFEKGLIDGRLIGQHSLEAWGQRLGVRKGDYKKDREEKAKELGITDPDALRLFVWGEWNEDLEAYGIDDIPVTTALWKRIKAAGWSEEAVRLEHRIHHLMFMQEQFGWQFDVKKAEKLAEQVQETYDRVCRETEEHFGSWYAPAKIYKGEPREQFGEDSSRKFWAEVTIPKKLLRYKDPLRGDRDPEAPYCEIKLKEFNPRSRQMVIDRFKTIYQWEPVDFTEKGNPSLDDDVLANLEQHIPIAASIREVFFYNKLLGALLTGEQAWLKSVRADGRVHGYVNVGGTVSGRASHLSPNMAQVPKVKSIDIILKDGSPNPKVLDDDGNFKPECYRADGTLKKTCVLRGRAGRFGWECRELFTAPPGWVLMGCDLSGVELRCFGARLYEFDNGSYLDIILNGDVHEVNKEAADLESRDQAKTFIYATLYGGGDEKIGSIVLPPSATAGQMKARGKQLKSNFEQGVPAYRKLIKKIAKDLKRGYLTGLDGRKLFARSSHSALNLQLQSDGALLAKTWCVFFHDMMEEAGYRWGVDWGLVGWIHDEIQTACRTMEIAKHAAEIAVQAAVEAGLYYDYPAPIAAEAKIGDNWAETH